MGGVDRSVDSIFFGQTYTLGENCLGIWDLHLLRIWSVLFINWEAWALCLLVGSQATGAG